MNDRIYPFLFDPIYKNYMWGGERIRKHFHREIDFPVCAESWEIADRPEGTSVIQNGAMAGRDLRWLMLQHAEALLGRHAQCEVFPLLVKILDASQRLSLQVHPDDETAKTQGGEAKSEMWYVLDAEPGALLYVGLETGTNQNQFQALLEQGKEESCLGRIEAQVGDVISIPGRRLHAIGRGCLLLEIQQNSNTTYRVSDWGRVDAQGNARALHLQQALRIIDWNDHAVARATPERVPLDDNNQCWSLLVTQHFTVERYLLSRTHLFENSQNTCRILFCSAGSATLGYDDAEIRLPQGRSALIPASCNSLSVTPDHDEVEIVSVRP